MTERQLQTMLVKGANFDHWQLFKITDGSVGKKPMDISGFGPMGLAVCCEVKLLNNSLNDRRQLPLSEFSPHQIAWLNRYAEAGAHAIIIIGDLSVKIVRCFTIFASCEKPWNKQMLQGDYSQRDLVYIKNIGGYVNWSQSGVIPRCDKPGPIRVLE